MNYGVSMIKFPEEAINNFGGRVASIDKSATKKMENAYKEAQEPTVKNQQPTNSFEDLETKINTLLQMDSKPKVEEVPTVEEKTPVSVDVSTDSANIVPMPALEELSDEAQIEENLGITGFDLHNNTTTEDLKNAYSNSSLNLFTLSAQNAYDKNMIQFEQTLTAALNDEKNKTVAFLKKASDKVKELKVDNTSLQDELSSTRASLENANKQISDLNKENSRLQEENELSRKQNKDLQAELDSSNEVINENTKEISNKDNIIRTLEAKIKERDEAHKREIDAMRKSYENKIAGLEKTQRKIREISSGNTNVGLVDINPNLDNGSKLSKPATKVSLNEYKELRDNVANVAETSTIDKAQNNDNNIELEKPIEKELKLPKAA